MNYRFKEPRVKSVTISHELQRVRVAKWWDLLPWELESLPAERQGLLMAAYQVDNEINTYYQQELEKISKDK